MHVQVKVKKTVYPAHSSGVPQLYAVDIDYAGRTVRVELPAYFVNGDQQETVDSDTAQAMEDLAEALQNYAGQLRKLLPPGR
jgi:hypothetical protein